MSKTQGWYVWTLLDSAVSHHVKGVPSNKNQVTEREKLRYPSLGTFSSAKRRFLRVCSSILEFYQVGVRFSRKTNKLNEDILITELIRSNKKNLTPPHL